VVAGVIKLMVERGADLSYHDPHIPRLPKMRHYEVPDLANEALTAGYLAGQDCVVIVTDHAAVDYGLVGKHSRLIVDTRNVMARVPGEHTNVRKA